jgi:hypothetical protein
MLSLLVKRTFVQGSSWYKEKDDRELFFSTPSLSIASWFLAVQSTARDRPPYPALRSLSLAFLVSPFTCFAFVLFQSNVLKISDAWTSESVATSTSYQQLRVELSAMLVVCL